MRYGIKTIFYFFTLITLAGCSGLTTFKQKRPQTVAFYNVENLYDTEVNPRNKDYTPTGAMQWTQERYQTKLNNIATVISTLGSKEGPAIIGLSEVENSKVIEDLLNTSPLRKKGYKIIHHESEDPLGLDVALLYKENSFKLTGHKAIRIQFNEANFNSKDILQVKGLLLGEPVTIYVNHWPPSGGNQRLGNQRKNAAAATLRQEIDAQFAIDPDANIILMGDFDLEPDSDILEKRLKATGAPDPAIKDAFFNTFYMSFVNGYGSYISWGDLQMIDQIMISKSLLDQRNLEFVRGSATIHKPVFIKHTFGKYKNTPRKTYSGSTYVGGYSDHFPVYIQVRKVK